MVHVDDTGCVYLNAATVPRVVSAPRKGTAAAVTCATVEIAIEVVLSNECTQHAVFRLTCWHGCALSNLGELQHLAWACMLWQDESC
jgi:hypothetical protein